MENSTAIKMPPSLPQGYEMAKPKAGVFHSLAMENSKGEIKEYN